MDTAKKNIEKWSLERFKNSIDDFPEGEIEPGEGPDFIVRGTDRTIGIELTDLYRKSSAGRTSEQAIESMRKLLVSCAQKIYEAKNLPPVIASFYLHNEIQIKKSEINNFSRELAHLVAENCPDPNSRCEIPDGWDDMRKLPNGLTLVSINRLDVLTKSQFRAPSATWVATLEQRDIEAAIVSKDLKYKSYKTKCDEVWLIISADTESMATWFELDVKILNKTYSSEFDRVFLVQQFRKKSFEIQLSK